MNELPSPTEVALRLAQVSRMLETAQGELVQADEKAVRARARYEVTEARAFLQAEASNAETRKRIALLAAADEKLDAEIAEQQVRSIKTRIDMLGKQVSVGQSMGAAVRSEWAAS